MKIGIGKFLKDGLTQASIESAFRRVVAGVTAGFLIEHAEDGTHGDVTADSVTADSVTTDTATVDSVTAGTVTADEVNVIGSLGTLSLTPDGGNLGGILTNSAVFETDNAAGLSIAATTSAAPILFYAGGTLKLAELSLAASGSFLGMSNQAFGTGAVAGPNLYVGYNTSGNGAPGTLLLFAKNGAGYYVWADTTGDLRIGTGPPEEDGTPSDTSGTVVGDQTSTRASKNIIGEFNDNTAALHAILRAPLYRFTYKSGARCSTEYLGIVAEDSPEFAQDEGRSFNPVSAFGYTVAAIKALERRIRELEAMSGRPD